jgi:hypothetical protein
MKVFELVARATHTSSDGPTQAAARRTDSKNINRGQSQLGPQREALNESNACTFYGETTTHSLKRLFEMVNALQVPFALDESSIFIDLGSGLGRVIFGAALLTACRSAIGVELVGQRVDQANKVSAIHEVGDMLRRTGKTVENRYGDITCRDWLANDPTHVYMFDAAMDPKTRSAVASLLNESTTWLVFISCRTPAEWESSGLWNVAVAGKLPMKMTGSNWSYAHFIYTRVPASKPVQLFASK